MNPRKFTLRCATSLSKACRSAKPLSNGAAASASATGIAAQLGYQAYGIEIEETLVDKAESLLADQGLDADFLPVSYIPDGFISYDALSGHDIVRDDSFGHRVDGNSRYDGMDIDIEEVDLFFVYPWPGEQEMMLKLFDAVAGEGAILVAYFGDRDICLYRKLEDEDD